MSENGHAYGVLDGNEIFVGDTVLVRGEALRSVSGVGALVRFTSKTENYEGWICEADLRYSVSAAEQFPAEPADGTWLLTYDREGAAQIFHRDDAEGHSDWPTRRRDRHWWDVVAKEWIDWSTAVLRGAARSDVQRMRVEEDR